MATDVNISSGFGNPLCCPSCGFAGGMHHGVVEVWDRMEDRMKGTYLRSRSPLIVNTAASVDHVSTRGSEGSSRNPSMRRSGIIITFECEMCPAKKFELKIAQHKGATLLDWDIIETAPGPLFDFARWDWSSPDE